MPDDGWLSCSQNSTHINFIGTPNNNAYSKTYDAQVIISDNNTSANDYTWNGTFTIIQNDPPTAIQMGSDLIIAPDGKTWIFGSSISNDPENLAMTKTLYIDGSTTIPSWLNYDLSDFSFWIITSSNSYAGSYNITVEVDDGFNAPVETEFALTIDESLAPIKLKAIPNYSSVSSQVLTIQFDPIDNLFDDPDDRPMVANVIQANGDPLPSFMTFDNVANTLSLNPNTTSYEEYIIGYQAKDDHNLTSEIVFTVDIKRKCL